MAIPAVSLYATSSTSVHTPLDFDINGRSPTCAASSPTQKPIAGGISRLFCSPSLKYTSSFTLDEIDVSTSFRSSAFNFCAKRDLSPVSVFHAPLSRTCTPPIRFFKNGGDFSGSLSFGATNTQFIRRALGSCVNYDSPTFQVQDNCPQVDELTFTMDHNFDSPDYAKDLLLNAQMRHKIFRDDFVIRAFNEAEKAHRGQMRASGDPYLQHCVETAVLLALIGANSTVVAAGLLHDTLDDSFKTYDHIFGSFGAGVADLVEGVSKLSQLSKLARESNTASKTNEADRLHTIFLAMADARAVLIKLADRLHNMITLDALPLIKQQRFAKETLEIFAPLANRLGIFKWKEQLENLCFKHLNPDQYNELSSKLSRSYDEAKITCCADKLEQALKDGAISYHVLSGRHKSLYSIYRKMMKKKLTVDEVHDIYGLRLIVGNEDDCYEALGIVHQLWSVVPGKFKDYIKHPKCNGYQSLHTVVIGEDMVPLEVQIRTEEMHLRAEFGFAAHWRYKEGDCKCSSFVLQMVEWARWVVTWQCQTMENDQSANPCHDDKPACTSPTHSKDCPNGSKPCCGDNEPVFVILIENDKMSVQEFPANSTVADLLERAGRGSTRRTPCRFEVKEELWPKLNRELVNDPSCKLKMGDVVEITPTISDKSLTVYREEIQRMYDGGPVSSVAPATTGAAA